MAINHGYWIVRDLVFDKAGSDGNAIAIKGGHVGVLHLEVRNGRGPNGIVTFGGAHDVILADNEVHHFQRTVDGQRADAHGIAVVQNSSRIVARSNTLHDNSGDGIQCQGVNDEGTPSESPTDSSDITLQDNRIFMNLENAVDIKSCQRVSVRGSVSPDQPGTAANNKFFGHSREGAVVIHFFARNILVENTRLFDSCEGIGVGRPDLPPVRNVVIRRNLFFDMVTSGGLCKGNGLRITNAQNVEIYHNTFDHIPGAAVQLTADNATAGQGDDHRVWDNIISNSRVWIDLYRPKGAATKFQGDRNLFWNDDQAGQLLLNFNAVSLPQWRSATGQDMGSTVANPMFVAAPRDNDYFTQAGSPARDQALTAAGTTFCGAGPDIGFRESCS